MYGNTVIVKEADREGASRWFASFLFREQLSLRVFFTFW